MLEAPDPPREVLQSIQNANENGIFEFHTQVLHEPDACQNQPMKRLASNVIINQSSEPANMPECSIAAHLPSKRVQQSSNSDDDETEMLTQTDFHAKTQLIPNP